MTLKGMYLPIWGIKLMLSIFFIYAVTGDAESACDSDCPTHRLFSVEISPVDTPLLYWFPPENVLDLNLLGDSCSGAIEVPESERRKWHAIHLHADFETGADGGEIGYRNGTFQVDIPSLNLTTLLVCNYEESITLELYYNEPSLWAFNCKAKPCVCPEEGNCSHIQKEECDVVSLSSLRIPLDTTFKFLWRPETLWPVIVLLWGSKFVAIQFEDIHSNDWPDFAIESRIFVNDTEGTWTSECLISVLGLLQEHDCSDFGYLNETAFMLLHVGSPMLFSLGCGPKEGDSETLSGYKIAIVAVALIVAIAFIALIVVRRVKRRASDEQQVLWSGRSSSSGD